MIKYKTRDEIELMRLSAQLVSKTLGIIAKEVKPGVTSLYLDGIPDKKPLKNGDVISIDCGVFMNGFYGDHAYTFEVGEVDPKVKKLLQVTKECLDLGIEQVKKGNRIGDVSFAIQHHAEKNGYVII